MYKIIEFYLFKFLERWFPFTTSSWKKLQAWSLRELCVSLLPASRLQFILIKNKKRRVGYESVLADLISKWRWDSFWWLCFKEYGNISILRRNDIISFSSSLLNYFQSLWPLDFQVLQMVLNTLRTMNQRLTRRLITLPVSPFHDSRQESFSESPIKKKKKRGGGT